MTAAGFARAAERGALAVLAAVGGAAPLVGGTEAAGVGPLARELGWPLAAAVLSPAAVLLVVSAALLVCVTDTRHGGGVVR